MGRFSSFVAKANEVVQQANDEYQRAKQQQHQQQQQPGQPVEQSRGQQTWQHSTSASQAQPYTYSHGTASATYQQGSQQSVNSPPPPLPPRQPTPSYQHHQPTQESPAPVPQYNYQAGSAQLPVPALPARPGTQLPDAQGIDPRSQHERQAALYEAQPKTAEAGRAGADRDGLQEKAHEQSNTDNDLARQLQDLHVAQPVRDSPSLSRGQEDKGPLTSSRSEPESRHFAPSVEDEPAPPPPPPPRPVPTTHDQVPKAAPDGLIPVKNCITAQIHADVDWFVHENAPDFLACSRCLVDHIYGSKLQSFFRHKRFDDFEKVARKCYFGSNHVKKRLWPQAVAAGNLDNMMEYMKSRPQIAECPQQAALAKHDWWTSPEVPGSSFCQACWSDEYEGGPFASHFNLETVDDPRVCDSSVLFIGRMYDIHSETNGWSEFAAEVKGRSTIPPCPGDKAIAGTAHAWMRSTREPKGIQVCYSCFADYFYGTTSAQYFQEAVLGEEKTICLMGMLNMKIPAQQAVAKKDPELYWKWMTEIDKQPFCSKEGIKGPASWYTLQNRPDGFAVCGACRAGIAEPVEWARHLIPLTNVSPEDTILCCFNPAHPRFADFMGCLVQSMTTDTWEKLGDYAATFANVPRCPRDSTTIRSNRRYWGWQSLRICQECYLSFAKGTALEPLFHLKGETVENSRLCDLYSPRMRKMYTDACEDRFPAQKLVDLAGERRMVYIHTMPEVDRLISQQRIKSMQATMYGNMGTSYKFMGGAQDAVMGHSYTLGNAAVGYGHVNELSFTGAQYDLKGRNLAAQATDGSVWHHISMLERRWREVE